MKKTAIIAIFAALVCACTSPSVTEISGMSAIKSEIWKIRIFVPETVDTTIRMHAGKFSVEIPACPEKVGLFEAGNFRQRFIPDGTPLDVLIDSLGIHVTCLNPEKSVQARFTDMKNANSAIAEKLSAKIAEIQLDTLLSSDVVEAKCIEARSEAHTELAAFNKETLLKNKDNYLAVQAILILRPLIEPSELVALISKCSTKVKENKDVKRVLEACNKAIAESAESGK